MAGELIGFRQFDFKGESLQYLADARGQYLGITRVCRSLGLDPTVEWREILQRDAFVNKVRVETLASGEAVYFLEAKALHAWLFTIASARVPAAYRARHTEWCEELIDAIYRYETKGVAIKAGTPDLQVIKECGEYLLSLNPTPRSKLLVASLLESEMLRLTDGGSPSAPKPTSVAYRCQQRRLGLTDSDVRKIGGLVAKRYRALHGKKVADMDKGNQVIGGRLTGVNQYTEDDLPLIDAEIDKYLKEIGHKAA